MGDQLKFFPLLSLQEMVLRRTAVLLWSHPDILSSVLRVERAVPYYAAEDGVRVKVSQLGLHQSLAKKLARVVRLVGLEVRRWKKFQDERFGCSNPSDSPGWTRLCWTSTGRIDYQKTLEELLRSETGVEQYILACDYCLEERVALLWEPLAEGVKGSLGDESNIRFGLCFQWPHLLRGEQSRLDEWARKNSNLGFNQFSFERYSTLANRSAADYFFRKLTPEERQDSLLRSLHSLREAIEEEEEDLDDPPDETFRYLLSRMSPEGAMETLRGHPIPFFLCFFDMVWPDLCPETVALVWKHLPPPHYARLLRLLAKKYERRDRLFPELLRKFLTRSPPDFKRRFVGENSDFDDSPACSLLSAFLKHGDSESVEALFGSLGVADRARVVFHRSVLGLLYRSSLRDDRWPTVERCLRKGAPFAVQRERLKRVFAGTFERRHPGTDWRENPKLKKVFDFLDARDERRGQKRKGQDCPEL